MPAQRNILGFIRGTNGWSSSRAWQVHPYCGAPIHLGVYRNSAAGLLRDPINLAESKARTAANRLCRKERFERFPQYVFRHPDPGIADTNAHIVAGRQFGGLASVA